MAKQSGLHQIRGKVGEHSYYKQSGVASGLIRSINQGMSARVKTAEEYANVRLNNREFGQAGRLSAMLANYITPKFRPMVLPFSQSKMAKVLLEYIKNDTTAPWGGRNLITANSGDAEVAALNAVVKNRFEDYGIHISGDEEENKIIILPTSAMTEKLQSIGASGVKLRLIVSTSWIGTYNETEQKYAPSYARGNAYENDIASDDTADWEVEYTLRPTPPQGWPAIVAERVGILIAMPYRTINGVDHTLQEHCTYFSWVLADGDII